MKVFFDARQVPGVPVTASPSANKAPLVIESWRKFSAIELADFEPATVAELERAHDPAFVRGVMTCKIPNGFGTRSNEVALTLPYTSGSMLAAARHAVKMGQSCVSPTSGFHHAGFDHAGGYCTFNGLMVAALAIKAEGLVNRVAILDLDQHYGNGTDNIIQELGLDWIGHYTFGGDCIGRTSYSEDLRRPTMLADAWLLRLPGIIARIALGADLLIYQAGADPHIDDPLGGTLTTEEMAERDRIVFTTCHVLGVPVAWNLAGGYQRPIEKVLALHDNTAREFLAVYERHETNGQQALKDDRSGIAGRQVTAGSFDALGLPRFSGQLS